MGMTVVPLPLRQASAFVTNHHRHHKAPRGMKFATNHIHRRRRRGRRSHRIPAEKFWTSSARTITLPPFLISLLRNHLERHTNDFVFTAESGNRLWRSTFIRPDLKPPPTETKVSRTHASGLS
jgi:hypothetical protein